MPTSHNIRLSAHFQVMTLRVHCIEKCELLCFHTTKSPGTAASTSFLSSLVPLLDLLWIPPSLLIKGPWELSLACPLKSIQAWFITSHIKKNFGGSPLSYCPPVYSLSSSSLKLNLNLPTVPSHLQFTTLLTASRPPPTSLHWNCSGLSHQWLPALISKGCISVLILPDSAVPDTADWFLLCHFLVSMIPHSPAYLLFSGIFILRLFFQLLFFYQASKCWQLSKLSLNLLFSLFYLEPRYLGLKPSSSIY